LQTGIVTMCVLNSTLETVLLVTASSVMKTVQILTIHVL